MSWMDWFRHSAAPYLPEPAPSEVQELRSEPRAGIPAGLIVRQEADLASVLCTALRPLILQAASREVRLLVAPAPEFPDQVRADALKLAWAVTALVGSALRFTRRGGVMVDGGAISVRIGWEPAAQTAVIQVADDGRGIPPEAFATLLDRGVGGGRVPSLQLLLIEDIVHGHGGTLEIRSRRGAGTTVTLRIPCP